MLKSYNPDQVTCNSGGAEGSDSIWELFCELYGVNTNAYSYKTKKHKSPNKVEISNEDYEEGVDKIKKANKSLKRKGIDKYMNLLARNWAQVKYSEEIFAIGNIVKTGDISKKGFKVTSSNESVDGGTGYAIQMAIDCQKTVYVFDQSKECWFKWSYILDQFIKLSGTPLILSENFAGIGTREITDAGKKAIEDVFIKTFDKK
jgi:hypothetical protein